ncbi:hypothetical protein R3P38DRAFT_2780034 [Favolaschia claudopus]|uniref:Uncharacterized protein n=1 Tax=Favolaschia claudopus TaxID=2862362 RepID=A0AAW0BB40_9AGAR
MTVTIPRPRPTALLTNDLYYHRAPSLTLREPKPRNDIDIDLETRPTRSIFTSAPAGSEPVSKQQTSSKTGTGVPNQEEIDGGDKNKVVKTKRGRVRARIGVGEKRMGNRGGRPAGIASRAGGESQGDWEVKDAEGREKGAVKKELKQKKRGEEDTWGLMQIQREDSLGLMITDAGGGRMIGVEGEKAVRKPNREYRGHQAEKRENKRTGTIQTAEDEQGGPNERENQGESWTTPVPTTSEEGIADSDIGTFSLLFQDVFTHSHTKIDLMGDGRVFEQSNNTVDDNTFRSYGELVSRAREDELTEVWFDSSLVRSIPVVNEDGLNPKFQIHGPSALAPNQQRFLQVLTTSFVCQVQFTTRNFRHNRIIGRRAGQTNRENVQLNEGLQGMQITILRPDSKSFIYASESSCSYSHTQFDVVRGARTVKIDGQIEN